MIQKRYYIVLGVPDAGEKSKTWDKFADLGLGCGGSEIQDKEDK